MNDEESRTEPADTGNDLQLLEGVGAAYAQALHDIGIHTFADLAAYESAAELQRALKERAKKTVSLKTIENVGGTEGSWIEQARGRAEESGTVPERHNAAEEEAVPDPEPESTEPNAGWRPVQEFTLFLDDRVDDEGHRQWQLRAYDGVSGLEDKFTVQDYNSWVEWIFDHAKMPESEKLEVSEQPVREPAAEPEKVADEPETAPVEPAQLDIIDVEVRRSPATERAELEASVTFRVSGAEAGRVVAERYDYQVEVYTSKMEDGTSRFGGYARGQLEPGRLEYESRVTFPMLELGRYELESMVLLFPPGEGVSFFKGSTFRIVP